MHAELTAGVHFGAARGMQFLAQFDVTLPFYRARQRSAATRTTRRIAMLSAGLGF